MTRLVGEDFGRLFTTFARSAFRLETLDWYTVDDEDEPLRAFLADKPIGGAWMAGWLEMIRKTTDEGRTPYESAPERLHAFYALLFPVQSGSRRGHSILGRRDGASVESAFL
jgi:hypothetical protein